MAIAKAVFEVKASSKLLTPSALVRAARTALKAVAIEGVKISVTKKK